MNVFEIIKKPRCHWLRFNGAGECIGHAFAGGPHPEMDKGETWVKCEAELVQRLQQGFRFSLSPDGAINQHDKSDAQLAAEVRATRNTLIGASDWTQLLDAMSTMSSETRAAWAAYRTALRDITDQPGFPREVQWPVKPG
jgi:hypothetical protein